MRSPSRWALLLLLLLTGLRLAYVGCFDLSPDEAYYQMWSERLDWGYYSKGPGVALAIRAGTTVFGVNEFGVRCLAPLLALGTSLALWALARRFYGPAVAVWTVALLNLTPIFQAGALLMTIDALSIFFWSAGMLTFWLGLERRRGGALPWWILTGLCVAAGFLSKYTNAMELLGIALALAVVPRWRKEFRRPGFYVMLATALAGFLPPIIWNSTHAWITLGHLRERGKLDSAFTKPLAEFGQFWGAQFGVYSPLVYLGLLIALWAAWRRARRQPAEPAASSETEKARFLLSFCLPLLVMYALLAFKTNGEPNWTAPAILSLSVVGAAFWHRRAQADGTARIFCVVALAISLLMSIALLDTDLLRLPGITWPYERDPTSRLLGWKSTAAAVATLRGDEERELGAPVFLIANRYQLAAELNFYLPAKPPATGDDPPVYLPESQNIENQFSFWPGYDQVAAPKGTRPAGTPLPATAQEEFKDIGTSSYLGHSALFITDDEHNRRLPPSLETGFEECRLVAQFEIRRRGQPLRHVHVYACFNYKGVDL